MKKILCVSASNIITARDNSASTKVCKIINTMIEDSFPKEFNIKTIELIDHDLTPCNMCEKCIPLSNCSKDEGFNIIFNSMIDSDAIFIVSPHYASIPSKLMILLEKLQEIFYLNYCKDSSYKFPLMNKHVGIIAHGGMLENFEDMYKQNLIIPLKNALGAIGLKIAKVNDTYGVVFGAKDYIKAEGSITPNIAHEWNNIKTMINPLVREVICNI